MITLSTPKPEILARRDAILAELSRLLPGDSVIGEAIRLRPYETDGLAAYRQMPLAVVLPRTTEEVAAVLRYCHANGIRVVPRGAGTSLAGGALPLADSVVIGLMRMNGSWTSTSTTALPWSRRASPTSASPRPWRATASSTRPTRRASSPA
jgi:glycolate oxidase